MCEGRWVAEGSARFCLPIKISMEEAQGVRGLLCCAHPQKQKFREGLLQHVTSERLTVWQSVFFCLSLD